MGGTEELALLPAVGVVQGHLGEVVGEGEGGVPGEAVSGEHAEQVRHQRRGERQH